MQLDRRSWATKAQEHLACAEALLDARHFANAYYLAGLAVECGLKACIARRFASETWPDRDFVSRLHTHSLPTLLLEALEETGVTTFDLSDVRVANTVSHFVNGALHAGGDPSRERVIGPQLVGGRFVERAYIYPSDPSAAPPPRPPGSRRRHDADAA